jgi:uncharacterized membrane protein YbjE (DUF340 family)
VSFDPFLYVAFGAGYIAGRLVTWRSRWIERATLVTVIGLLLLLGASLGGVAPSSLAQELPLALVFVALTLGFTALAVGLLPSRPAPPAPADGPRSRSWLLIAIFATAVLVGFALVSRWSTATSALLEWALYVLLFLVAFDLKLTRQSLRSAWRPLTASFAGAIAAALAMIVALGIPWRIAFATSLAFGWYTLAGPLVAANAGAGFGLLAFLTNFLREDLTLISAPWAGRRIGGEGLAALGGATAMDTTLYSIVRFGDRSAGGLAVASGLVLTVVASLLLPALLAA